jgi:hypothetical protein
VLYEPLHIPNSGWQLHSKSRTSLDVANVTDFASSACFDILKAVRAITYVTCWEPQALTFGAGLEWFFTDDDLDGFFTSHWSSPWSEPR